MANMEKIQFPRLKEFATRYRVEKGKGFRLKDYDPDDTGGLRSETKRKSGETSCSGALSQWLTCRTNSTQRIAGASADLSGDGCRRQRQHD